MVYIGYVRVGFVLGMYVSCCLFQFHSHWVPNVDPVLVEYRFNFTFLISSVNSTWILSYMFVHACMHVCVCVQACVLVHTYMSLHVTMCLHANEHTYGYVYQCMHVCVCTHM